MNFFRIINKSALILLLVIVSSCKDQLTEMNENPNGIDPATANPNLLMPTVMTGAAKSYLELGFGDIAGVMQHTQKSGWYSGHNTYDWTPQDWAGWYGLLRSNNLMFERAVDMNLKFHQGVALTMKSFIFGVITDLWGDAPYTNAVKGNLGSTEFNLPAFDSQEVIYAGIINDLKSASELFASGDVTGVLTNYDVYYKGDASKWQKFANTLLLRYYLRISDKMPDVAKAGIESIYSSGIYINEAGDDATMSYIGASTDNAWPGTVGGDGSDVRNRKPAIPLLSKLMAYQDPRMSVWFAPVRVRWIADPTLPTAVDAFIRKDGVIQEGVTSIMDEQFQKTPGNYTRHFNPALYNGTLDTGEYVGMPVGILLPDAYNGNPTPGQVLQNQHVSQLADIYRKGSGDLLKARLASAAETHFILAEAALKGWSVGSAEEHYKAGIESSLDAWGVAGEFSTYIAQEGVSYTGSLAQIMEQKWIASWTAVTEAWFDFRRTGYPELQAGPASPEPVLPVRFIYGDNEILLNANNSKNAIDKLQVTPHSGLRGKNSQWSKPWIIAGTNKPW
ncbi:SusD/RagB family nutrient-binding outer membrane lipoprotein [Rhodocytophaga aerolata]|uniref:SusD/RagB family nutrient-binding outer membrane lipoprotein n=1 Tax=Rhodocytophaga aerolata TaxID=455078 RepID=A0ABT8RA42_9BACT|nr:SusD/RagB family nutrient-binding outer membrane lipoprotein [Rhodocytophaga aerolata]MDO1448970.1 SusD/RagB family nutrient-binding outer membrane lipoprotein [Rhodocytophaga aerolata]